MKANELLEDFIKSDKKEIEVKDIILKKKKIKKRNLSKLKSLISAKC